jgi:hypothetical protein
VMIIYSIKYGLLRTQSYLMPVKPAAFPILFI